jgi:hypothetical protein
MGDGKKGPLARGNSNAQHAVDGANTQVTVAGGVDAALQAGGGKGLPGFLGPLGALLGGWGLMQDSADLSAGGGVDSGLSAAANGAGLGSYVLGKAAGTAGATALAGAGGGAATMGGIAAAGPGAIAAAGGGVLAAGAAGLAVGMAGQSFTKEHGLIGQNADGTNRDWSDMAADWGVAADGVCGPVCGGLATAAGSVVGAAGAAITGVAGIAEGLWDLGGDVIGAIGDLFSGGSDKKAPAPRPRREYPDTPSPPSGGPCFGPGTLVLMSDGTERPIEEVLPGDWVRAYDESTGDPVARVVLEHHHTPPKAVLEVQAEDGPPIVVTTGHRFYVAGEWVPIGEVPLGDSLTHIDVHGASPVELVARRALTQQVACHNLAVQEHHNYVVHGLLVHNAQMAMRRPMSDMSAMSAPSSQTEPYRDPVRSHR